MGSHPRWTPKNIMARSASQKVGMAKPTNTNTVVNLSKKLPALAADNAPSGMATQMMISRERTLSRMVMGSRSAILSSTGRPSGENDFPKSR